MECMERTKHILVNQDARTRCWHWKRRTKPVTCITIQSFFNTQLKSNRREPKKTQRRDLETKTNNKKEMEGAAAELTIGGLGVSLLWAFAPLGELNGEEEEEFMISRH